MYFVSPSILSCLQDASFCWQDSNSVQVFAKIFLALKSRMIATMHKLIGVITGLYSVVGNVIAQLFLSGFACVERLSLFGMHRLTLSIQFRVLNFNIARYFHCRLSIFSFAEGCRLVA